MDEQTSQFQRKNQSSNQLSNKNYSGNADDGKQQFNLFDILFNKNNDIFKFKSTKILIKIKNKIQQVQNAII